MSSSSNLALQNLLTPPTSLNSDDDIDEESTPEIGNPAQLLPYTPNRCHHLLQTCQQKTPIPDTLESPTQVNRGQSDIFRPYVLTNPSTSNSLNNPLNISAVAGGLQNLALQPHPARNEWVMGCLVCGKS